MTFDMNDVAPLQSGDLIPDGAFAKVTMSIRKGGTDGASEVDRGLLGRAIDRVLEYSQTGRRPPAGDETQD